MRHLVLGNGNLGIDLINEGSRRGFEMYIADRSHGWEWPHKGLIDQLVSYRPDVLWVAVGCGGVNPAKLNYTAALSVNAGLPAACLSRFPQETLIVLFSSDYAASEEHPESPAFQAIRPRSMLAWSHIHMENLASWMGRPNTAIIRLSSLYGASRPDRSFPGRLIVEHPRPDFPILMPPNYVTPTPTAWLAKRLHDSVDRLRDSGQLVHHFAPGGGVRISDWARIVLGPKYSVDVGPEHPERPPRSALGSTLGPTSLWSDLWNEYGAPIWRTGQA